MEALSLICISGWEVQTDERRLTCYSYSFIPLNLSISILIQWFESVATDFTWFQDPPSSMVSITFPFIFPLIHVQKFSISLSKKDGSDVK